jgi:hypothetical protein
MSFGFKWVKLQVPIAMYLVLDSNTELPVTYINSIDMSVLTDQKCYPNSDCKEHLTIRHFSSSCKCDRPFVDSRLPIVLCHWPAEEVGGRSLSVGR